MSYSNKTNSTAQTHTKSKVSKTYFEGYIENEKTRINHFQSLLSDCKTDVQIQKCNLFLFNLYKNVIYCRCSLKKRYFVQFNDEFYAEVKEFLALYKKLSTILPESEIIDALAIDYLFSNQTDAAFNAFYSKLKELSRFDVYREIYSLPPSELATFMKERWYSMCETEDFPWYDSHLNEHDTFVGYFSFVASAIAKKNALPANKINYLIG